MEAVFFIAILICIAVLILSLRARQKNYGFVLSMVLLIICNALVVFLIKGLPIKTTRNLFLGYYLAYSWTFLGSLWTIVRVSGIKKYRPALWIMGAVCAFLTFLVYYFFNRPHAISFSKRILIGRIWWIAEGPSSGGDFLGIQAYNTICIIATLFIVAVSIACLLNVHRMFRGKYVMLSILQLILMIMAVLETIFHLPIWIYTLIMNPVFYLTYYYVFIQSDSKLRSEVIMSFANEMSDGLILYNGYKDLIHVNDLIKNLIDADFLERLKDVEVLEEWLSHVEYVENIRTLPYRRGDEEIYFTVRKHELGTDNSVVGTVYILHDTTNSINQIRLMEKVNSELERTSRMKSDFLANMSHELRTPMNAVIGMAEIALREESSPRVKDCLHQINSSGKNLLNIINDILDYSKIDAGKMEIVPDKYEPLSEVNDISNILQTRIGEKNLELYFIVDPSLPHALIGDSMRIRQVLINLANNAIKFTQAGKIRISLTCERVSKEALNLIFHITDTGQGIKEEDLDKLFVSFTQVDSKRNRNVEGTGLGLAISKSLCEAMGGTIGVKSIYGKGSDFWFVVPQKIADDGRDLVVEDAADKYVYCLNENELMTNEFSCELDALGLSGSVIPNLSAYSPSGKKDFLFFEEHDYTDEIKKFLDEHPDVTGVILTGFGSTFRPMQRNVTALMRPQTTLSMVLTLNNKDISSMNFSSEDDSINHFIAPDARVLIVDDNSINLSIAVGLLEPMKIVCDVAQSGMEAIEKAKGNTYDLILMDHMMPVMDGIETTQAIRSEVPSADDTPIVALTANVMEGSKELFLNAGMVDMIAKPIDVKQLNLKLYTWLPEYKIRHMDADEIEEMKKNSGSDYELYDCLDCEKAIKGLGSVTLLQKIVQEYYKRGRNTLAEIESAKENNDLADYAIKTHSLKSSSRQIGAFELGDLAEKLEKAGKENDMATIEQYHSQTMELLDRLLGDLSKYFPEEEEEAGSLPAISETELRVIFENLTAACNNLEMDEMEDCVMRLKGFSYPEGKDELIRKLCEAVDMMDTEGCMEIMESYYK